MLFKEMIETLLHDALVRNILVRTDKSTGINWKRRLIFV